MPIVAGNLQPKLEFVETAGEISPDIIVMDFCHLSQDQFYMFAIGD